MRNLCNNLLNLIHDDLLAFPNDGNLVINLFVALMELELTLLRMRNLCSDSLNLVCDDLLAFPNKGILVMYLFVGLL